MWGSEKVPLIFWGEPSAEYAAYFSYEEPEMDEERFNRFVNLGINADILRLGGSVDYEFKPYTFPEQCIKELNFKSVC